MDSRRTRCYCSSSCSSSSAAEDEEEEGTEDEDSWGSRSTAEAYEVPTTRGRRESQDEIAARAAATGPAAAAVTAHELLDARRLADLLDPEHLVNVLDGCLASEYVRGCVVETWDSVLSDHLDAIAHLVLYQTAEHAVGQAVYEQLIELSAAVRPPNSQQQQQQQQQQQPAKADAERVYGTLRSAARSLLATRVDGCCRQNMCRAVGLAVVALRANTRPVFTVENFLVEINEAANFANLYCTTHARRICAALKGIYDAVMAGQYHPTNVLVQMAVMEKSIGAALCVLADAQATGPQKARAQRSLLAELDSICATVRMKNHGCCGVAAADGEDAAVTDRQAVPQARAVTAARRFVHFTLSPWRAPIRMYHQQSPVSMDRVLGTTVRLVEMLVSELFKPCLNHRSQRQLRRSGGHRQRRDRRDTREKHL